MAEVQAFIELSEIILNRSSDDLTRQFPDISESLHLIRTQNLSHVIERTHMTLFEAKRQKTLAKLTQMMELYVGDSWDDPIEVLEWLSFYAGSALAHVSLTAAALEALGSPADVTGLPLSKTFNDLLVRIMASLASSGARLAKQ